MSKGSGPELRAQQDDDTDRIIFMETLAKVVADYNWLCHSYCLMDNHRNFRWQYFKWDAST